MATLRFYPVGNGDTTLLELHQGRLLLFDFKNTDAVPFDVPGAIRAALDDHGGDELECFAASHGDLDHVGGAGEFFRFDHAAKYQGSGRVAFRQLWIPAGFFLESEVELTEDARIVQAEARYRMTLGEGVLVFAAPGALDSWLRQNGIDPERRRHLLVDAGKLVPGYDASTDGLEIFAHAPFAKNSDGTGDRNDTSLVLHLTFYDRDKSCARVWLTGDATHEIFSDIVGITERHGRLERLEWNLFHTAHHNSYTALAPKKGTTVTVPVPDVDRLLTHYGADVRPIVVSSCDPIDSDHTPPHEQAAAYYRTVVEHDDDFLVTGEHPVTDDPQPIIVGVSDRGLTVKRSPKNWTSAGAPAVQVAPRFGRCR